jgi:hypothetical protein
VSATTWLVDQHLHVFTSHELAALIEILPQDRVRRYDRPQLFEFLIRYSVKGLSDLLLLRHCFFDLRQVIVSLRVNLNVQFNVHFAGPAVLRLHFIDRCGSFRRFNIRAFSARFYCHEGSAAIFPCHKRLDVDVVVRRDYQLS